MCSCCCFFQTLSISSIEKLLLLQLYLIGIANELKPHAETTSCYTIHWGGGGGGGGAMTPYCTSWGGGGGQ